ncbi:hypothetical protein Herbaro_21765 [Herbaspirillum sp. WKF16]|jgi:AraC-like DNA-binding protein|uniref:hypothetical protein n=1 Tax=Herbaspirillum sp. WKF16 TaxID=3028312 RepID=UPI0023A9EB39|nr:hypothetical protein [Herbaspirillum sp. WKF16]WDZ96072.1 hypothetical protein Herbaro_21765 [Herbaspirillum sp. WKF16]
MAIVTQHHLQLRELRFAAPARVKVWKGAATLRSGGVAIELREGESFTVPSFVRFSCLAHPRPGAQAARPAVWSLALESDASDEMERAADASKPWARRLAAAIFAEPAADWSAARIARLWQLTPARLRARLFAEGESLRSLVREQRVAWILARLARINDARAEAGAAGFASAGAMARACQDAIGLPPEIAGRAISLLSAGAAPSASIASARAGEAGRRPRYRPYF